MSHFQGPDILQAGSLLGHLMELINIIFTYAFTAMASQNGCHEKMYSSGHKHNKIDFSHYLFHYLHLQYAVL